MKLGIISFLSCLMLIASIQAAYAQSSRLYFAGYMGLNTYTEQDFTESTTATSGDLEYKNAVSLAGALGLRLTHEWRVEAEISRRSADLNRGDFNDSSFKLGGEQETLLYLLSLYYDMDWTWKNFRPFFTVGLGLATHESEITDTAAGLPRASDDSMGFAWAVGGGLKYRISDDVALNGGYRYIGANDLETDSYDVEFTTHEFRLGVEYDLPIDWFKDK